MKMGKKERSYLMVAIGLLLLVAAFMYGRSLSAKRETLVTENASLEQEVAYLQDLMDHREEYEAETSRMALEMEDIKDQFPAGIMPETQIMYANGLDSKLEVLTESLDMPGVEMVTVSGVEQYVEEPIADASSENAEGDAAAEESTQEIASTATSITLYRNPLTINYQASYDGIKDLIKDINEDVDRKSIEELTITYDTQTGNLTGKLTLNMYSLEGTGKVYEEPVVTGVTNGKSALISGATTFNRTGAAQAGDADTADGKTESGEQVEENAQ